MAAGERIMRRVCSVGSWREQSCPAHRAAVWASAWPEAGSAHHFILPMNSYSDGVESARQVGTP